MKKMNLFVPVMAISLFIVGCTSPTQQIAADAIQRGINQEHSIINDLSKIAKQSAVDKGVIESRAAALAQDPDAAQAAVEKAFTQFDKVNWLQIQHERARNMLRFGQIYVSSQKGIFDLMVTEFKESKARADAKRAGP